MTINLAVTKRSKNIKAKTLRQSGYLPAVVYGPKQETIALSVEGRLFGKVFKAAGESTIVTLTGFDEEMEVLVQNVTFDVVKGGITHIDFYAIEHGKELTTGVPLEFVGEAPALKTGAVVNKIIHEVNVTCRPNVLPAQIAVDLVVLTVVEDQIKVADLTLPEGVKIENDENDVIANVSPPRSEEETEAGDEEPDIAAIPVEQKGKAEATAEGQ